MALSSTNTKSEICRVCLEGANKMYPLKGEIVNVDVDVATMITYCTSIKVQLEEGLPRGVCIPCFRTIRIAYNFIRQFKEANKKLLEEQELIGNSQEENIVQNEQSVKQECHDETQGQEITNPANEEILLNYTDTFYDSNEETYIEEYKVPLDEHIEYEIVEGMDETEEYYAEDNTLHNEISEESETKFDIAEKETDVTDQNQNSGVPESNNLAGTLLMSQVQPKRKRKVYLKEHKCPVCKMTFPDFETKLVNHFYMHEEQDVECKTCSEVFSMNKYIVHYRLAHKFQCDICSRNFNSRTTFSYHLKTHTGSEKLSCPFESCSRSFTTSWCLKKHMNVHSSAIKYICSKCGAKFVTYDTFRYHFKTHDGKRNFLCTECGRTFLQAIHLKYHMYRHQGIKQFKCDSCEKRYTSTGALKKHKRKTLCGVPVKHEELSDEQSS